MHIFTNKSQENNQRAAAIEASQSLTQLENNSQLIDNRPEAILQKKIQAIADSYSTKQQPQSIQKEAIPELNEKDHKTGLPNNLKSGIENLSGFSMEDVKVHYHSEKPAQLQASAYAQGTDIHLAPGQERHLPHEAWHVVQQKQGRVKPTTQIKAFQINDDTKLEQEADLMGAKALAKKSIFPPSKSPSSPVHQLKAFSNNADVVQLQKGSRVKDFSNSILRIKEICPYFLQHKNIEKEQWTYPSMKEELAIEIKDNLLILLKFHKYFPIFNEEEVASFSSGDYDTKLEEFYNGSFAEKSPRVLKGLNELTKAKRRQIEIAVKKDQLEDWSYQEEEGLTTKEKVNKASNSVASLNLGDLKDAALGTGKDAIDLAEHDTGAFAGPQESPTIQDNWVKREESSVGIAEDSEGRGGMDTDQARNTAFGLEGFEVIFAVAGGLSKLSQTLTEDVSWDKRVVHIFETAEALTGATVSAMKSARAIQHAQGDKKDEGIKANIAEGLPIVNTIKSTFSGIKKVVESVIDTYKEYKQQSKVGSKKSEKVMMAGDVAIRLGEVLEAGFVVARDFFRILDSSKVPVSVINGIPGVGIAIASVSLLMNGYKAYKAGKRKNEMEEKVKLSQEEVGEDLGNLMDQIIALGVDYEDKAFFHVEMRGALLTSKAFYRVRPDFREALHEKVAELQSGVTEGSGLTDEEENNIESELVSVNIESPSKTPKAKYKRKKQTWPAKYEAFFEGKELAELEYFMQVLDRYEFISKMVEINQKRQVKGWAGVLDNLVTIGANIANLTGVGAPVGSAISIAQSAGKAGIGIAKTVQSVYRNAVGSSKSKSSKEKQYVNHAKFLFKHIQSLPPISRENIDFHSAKYEDAHKLMKATGVNTRLVYYEDDPVKAFKLVVEAMGERG